MQRITAHRALVVALCLLRAPSAFSQTQPSAERAFRDTLVHRQLYLRDFNAEEDVHGAWDGASLQMQAPRYHAFAAFIPTAIEITQLHVRLHGTLQLAKRTSETQVLLAAETMPTTITIDVSETGPASVLPRLRSLLFYKDLSDALHGIPEPLQKQLPLYADPQRGRPAATPPCDCADVTPACAGRTRDIKSPGWKLPKVQRQEEAEMPANPSFRAYSAAVALEVDEHGSPTDVWLTSQSEADAGRPLALSATKWLYTPATCHDQPAPAILFVESFTN